MAFKYLTIFIFLFISSCSVKEKNQKTAGNTDIQFVNSKANRTKEANFEEFAWKDYTRVIGLLSAKYKVPNSNVRRMVLEYLRINQPLDYYKLTLNDENSDTSVLNYVVKPKEFIDETLMRISTQSGIRKDSVSLILFDFELWYGACKLNK